MGWLVGWQRDRMVLDGMRSACVLAYTGKQFLPLFFVALALKVFMNFASCTKASLLLLTRQAYTGKFRSEAGQEKNQCTAYPICLPISPPPKQAVIDESRQVTQNPNPRHIRKSQVNRHQLEHGHQQSTYGSELPSRQVVRQSRTISNNQIRQSPCI